MHDFPTPRDPHPCGPWDKSTNPYPSRNRIIPTLATTGAPGTTQPAASWFLGPDGCFVGNYVISQRVWVLAILFLLCHGH